MLSTECRPTIYIIYSRAVLSRVNEENLPMKELIYQLECQCVFGIGLDPTHEKYAHNSPTMKLKLRKLAGCIFMCG